MSKDNLHKLTIPIYLNTKIVFDMLATIDDGFSQVCSIEMSSSKNSESKNGAILGTGNFFGLLNFGVQHKNKKNLKAGETVQINKTHTPVSLFHKLQDYLDSMGAIKREYDKFEVGDFVEIQGNFRNNPLIEVLNGFKEFVKLSEVFPEDHIESNKQKKGSKKKNFSNKKTYTQIDALLASLQAENMTDIICEAIDNGNDYKVVLPSDINYFINNNIYEITDGKYQVFGKVVQVYNTEGEISLLRNTVFARLSSDKVEEFAQQLYDSNSDNFLKEDSFAFAVKAPAIMIVPIAIYI